MRFLKTIINVNFNKNEMVTKKKKNYQIFQSGGNACINPSLAKYNNCGSLSGDIPIL